MKDNWDSVRKEILAFSDEEKATIKDDLSEKIPDAKSLVDVLFDSEADSELFQEECFEIESATLKEIANKFVELKLMQVVEDE